MAASHILDRVHVGDLQDAAEWDGPRVCVLEREPDYPTPRPTDTWVPAFRVAQTEDGEEIRTTPKDLDRVADEIERLMGQTGKEVLVHCGAGMERSPLVVAWWLHRKQGMAFAAAYDHVARARPSTQRRESWIRE